MNFIKHVSIVQLLLKFSCLPVQALLKVLTRPNITVVFSNIRKQKETSATFQTSLNPHSLFSLNIHSNSFVPNTLSPLHPCSAGHIPLKEQEIISLSWKRLSCCCAQHQCWDKTLLKQFQGPGNNPLYAIFFWSNDFGAFRPLQARNEQQIKAKLFLPLRLWQHDVLSQHQQPNCLEHCTVMLPPE